MLKPPSVPEITATLLNFAETVAPATGCPLFELVTVPVTVFVWAKQETTANSIPTDKSIAFLINRYFNFKKSEVNRNCLDCSFRCFHFKQVKSSCALSSQI